MWIIEFMSYRSTAVNTLLRMLDEISTKKKNLYKTTKIQLGRK